MFDDYSSRNAIFADMDLSLVGLDNTCGSLRPGVMVSKREAGGESSVAGFHYQITVTCMLPSIMRRMSID